MTRSCGHDGWVRGCPDCERDPVAGVEWIEVDELLRRLPFYEMTEAEAETWDKLKATYPPRTES